MKTPLQPRQLTVAHAVLDSIDHERGLTFTVLMSPADINELSAHFEAFLLCRYQLNSATLVKACPAYHPGVVHGIRRLAVALDNPVTRPFAQLHLATVQVRRSHIVFCSAEPGNALPRHAAPLLEISDAQEFDEQHYFHHFQPMTASTRATVVLYATADCPDSLFHHQRIENRRLEAQDHLQRDFSYPWAAVPEDPSSHLPFGQPPVATPVANHQSPTQELSIDPTHLQGRQPQSDSIPTPLPCTAPLGPLRVTEASQPTHPDQIERASRQRPAAALPAHSTTVGDSGQPAPILPRARAPTAHVGKRPPT